MKIFLKFIGLYLLACISWGKYMWDKSQEVHSPFFKYLALAIVISSFFYLIFLYLNRKKGS
jgi:hypothetical protein